MTLEEFSTYKLLISDSYSKYVLELKGKAQTQRIDFQLEYDTKLWILSKCVNIIFDYEYSDFNVFTPKEMLQWQDIMNDIMKTRLYVDFEVE